MIKRKLESTILEMLETFRIVAINGPRQSGKTTLQKLIAKERSIKYYTFDDIDIFNAATTDPKGFISYISRENAAIDEVQLVPETIPAIKMSVDEQNRKGMFLLTGSSDMFKSGKIRESLAGRMVNLKLFPLSYAEINNRDVNVIDKLFGDEFTAFELNETVKKEDFARAVINGGYPEIYNLSARAKKNWFEFYIK
ncbi:MAG: AAA family ATPase, partial [Pseudomonadota bacterium]|nr:AAA family ATPase [Pseudomonadota bacterium]